ncbi:hypothetical protein MLD38_021766 [Melastoma candidum]|uniref:Uncharacterized protein n=1 Tax=Melastoma candidum TaxID=119954 RepID=A0ACB9QHL9_9MYRT|nr:hypothetical protein MLD38_021766 [Melastoma candidum]
MNPFWCFTAPNPDPIADSITCIRLSEDELKGLGRKGQGFDLGDEKVSDGSIIDMWMGGVDAEVFLEMGYGSHSVVVSRGRLFEEEGGMMESCASTYRSGAESNKDGIVGLEIR